MDKHPGILRLYCAQINPTVGDFKGNFEKIAYHIGNAEKNNVKIIAFPELAVTGYPPEDLLLKPAFVEENIKYLEKIKNISGNIVVIIGFVNKAFEIYNSAAIICNKKIISICNKQYLPNYSVFDEERYFQKGSGTAVYELDGVLFGVNICEDIYYSSGPLQLQSIAGGASLIVNLSASPYHVEKIQDREKMLFARATDNRVNILYVNLAGGQDELVFDGNSMLVSEKGRILYRARPFEEDFFMFDLDMEEVNATRLRDTKFKNQRDSMRSGDISVPVIKINMLKTLSLPEIQNTAFLPGIQTAETPGEPESLKRFSASKDYYRELISCREEEVFEALVLGTRDYINKNSFRKVVLGLSGGIDSALTAVIASFAIGKENVTGVLMPSMFSSKGSIDDSLKLAENLGLKTLTIPIKDLYDSYLKNLEGSFKTGDMTTTKENLQARIRGNILMSFSNEYGWLVLATGNKSEISVGYCTLYGDMVGGFSPIKDIYKTMVYAVCDFINRKYLNIIPESIIKKAPSAELKPDQTDQDKLPPYDVLDRILKYYIEDEKDYTDIVKSGIDEATVKEVLNMVDFNEYKRRQGAPGIKITARAFGRDRRYPVTNRFRLT
jgi:NAD+ synthase (glutamine-hydrolysing)